ncbi:hypothetical protein ACF1GT_14560 [Streptomyces sp. NPDC014636]|uniref:hypothetical protein n=1 Tax=Streptomyces sp. NPDC014636 TaxID=3364876 RepID=UPI0036FF1262
MPKPRMVASALAGTALLFLPLLLAAGAGQDTGDLPWTGISARGNVAENDLPWT